MNRYAWILVFAFVLCGYRVFAEWRKKHAILKAMEDRRAYTDAEFGAAFFAPEVAPIAAEIHRMLRQYLPYDTARVRPEDRFVEDLQISRFYRTGMVAMLMEIERKYDVRLRHRPGLEIATLGDLIEAVARQVGQKTKKS